MGNGKRLLPAKSTSCRQAERAARQAQRHHPAAAPGALQNCWRNSPWVPSLEPLSDSPLRRSAFIDDLKRVGGILSLRLDKGRIISIMTADPTTALPETPRTSVLFLNPF